MYTDRDTRVQNISIYVHFTVCSLALGDWGMAAVGESYNTWE